jgi:tetratricopeptide (TPR) repeat protein
MAATEGYATPGTMRVFSHARTLLGDGGTLTEQMTVLWGTFLAHNMRAEHDASLNVARQCLALAERHEHPGMSALANRFMGQTLNIMGSLVEARVHLERTIDLCTANEEAIAAYRSFGIDDQVSAMFNLSRALLLLGYPDQSTVEAQRAVSRAARLGLPFTIALALSHEVMNGVLRGDIQRAAARADDAIANSVQHELPDTEHMARFMKGAMLAQSGELPIGLEAMRKAMAAQRKAVQGRLPMYSSLYLGYVADAHASLGESEVGLDLLDQAIETAEMTNERFFEAELYRLRGKMLSGLGKRGEAEVELQRALSVARQQQARWWELRAATSLAEHWRDAGKSEQAYSLLQPIYGWFVEGFDTTAMKNAKALLSELSNSSSRQAQF